MKMNRRNLLKQLGAGVAAGSVLKPVRAGAAEMAFSTPQMTEKPGPHGLIYLDHNENAYGASPKATAAMKAAAGQASRYPDHRELHSALATHHSQIRGGAVPALGVEQIALGCGSTDILRMAAAAFLKSGLRLIQATPTCGLIGEFARSRGAEVTEVPLRKDHAHDLSAMLERAKSGGSGLLYVCNPNTPTATLSTRKELDEFLAAVPAKFHVVMDEAYHAYAGGSGSYVSFVDRPSENPRVIVTRTFSTAYGLAGARLGYGVGSAEVIQKLKGEALPFAISGPAIAAALAALSDQEHVADCTKRNSDDRQEFMNQVNARMLRALDSHANFVCLNVMRLAGEIVEHYRKNNFVLAPQIPSMPTYLRISLGTPEEMMTFWKTYDLLGSHPMSM
jgi:histidinol-phosphate aminotransferase